MAMMQVTNMLTGAVSYVDDGEPEPILPPPTVEEYRAAIVSHLNDVAQSRGYDSQLTIATHATSANPQWAAEAQAFVAWRDAVWSYVYGLWGDPPETPPTVDELIASLPEIEWPAD